MKPIKICFEISNIENTKIKTLINSIVDKNRKKSESLDNCGTGYIETANTQINSEYKEEILEILNSSLGQSIQIYNSKYECELKSNGSSERQNFDTVFKYAVKSVEYNCIEILAEKTFICYSDDSKELKFIKPASNTKVFIT